MLKFQTLTCLKLTIGAGIAKGVTSFKGGLSLPKGAVLTVTLSGGDTTLNMAMPMPGAACDATARIRHAPYQGAPRVESTAATATVGSACCPGGACGPDGSCSMLMAAPGSEEKSAGAPHMLSGEQQVRNTDVGHVSGLAMALGAVVMFLLGSVLGPRLEEMMGMDAEADSHSHA